MLPGRAGETRSYPTLTCGRAGPTEPTGGEGRAVRSAGPVPAPRCRDGPRAPASLGCQPMMLTARAMTSTTAATETADWSIIMAFAQRVSGMTSLEAKEMALLNDRWR